MDHLVNSFEFVFIICTMVVWERLTLNLISTKTQLLLNRDGGLIWFIVSLNTKYFNVIGIVVPILHKSSLPISTESLALKLILLP